VKAFGKVFQRHLFDDQSASGKSLASFFAMKVRTKNRVIATEQNL